MKKAIKQEFNQVPVDDQLNTTLLPDPEFPFVFFHDDLRIYKGGFVNWHKQTQIEISPVRKGSVVLGVLGEERVFHEGDIFVVMPGFLHMVRPFSDKEEACYNTLIFEPKFVYGYEGSFLQKKYMQILETSPSAFYYMTAEEVEKTGALPMIDRISSSFETKDADKELVLLHLLQELWIRIYPCLHSGSGQVNEPQTAKLKAMLDYIHANYTEPFSLTDLSAACGQSRGECCRYFKKMMHLTLLEYLTEYRIKKAMSLLETTTLAVTQIGFMAGFPDTSYFIKRFRAKTGCSPLQYRAVIKEGTGKGR